MQQIELFELDGKNCWLCAPTGDVDTSTLPVLILLEDSESGAKVAELATPLGTKEAVVPFLMAGFATEDWNAAFSPWPSAAMSEKAAPFSGGAPDTLAWVMDTFMPALKERHGFSGDPENSALVGYSLGGLFSLWAMYQTDRFKLCGCCSGSLWYDDWPEFMQSGHPTAGCRIYLSLGKSEEKARNERLAKVGDNTRSALALLKEDSAVTDVKMQKHDGGHFHEVPKRLTQAIAWLMQTPAE